MKCAFSEAKYIKIVDSGTLTKKTLNNSWILENNTSELTNLFEREIEIHGNFDNFKVNN